MSGNRVENEPNRPIDLPPPPRKIETPEDALAQANADEGGTVLGATHAQTQANLADSRRDAIDRAMQEGRSGDVTTINAAYDQAQARLDANNAEYRARQGEAPTRQRTFEQPDGTTARESIYADGTRIVHTDGVDANGNAVVTTRVIDPDATGASALVPLEGRSVVANGVSTTTGLPVRTVQDSPDGQGSMLVDTYGSAEDPQRVVQHLVLPDGQGGHQVQSVVARENGVDAGTPPALRIREFDRDGALLFDTGEVSRVTTTPVPGREGVSTVTHIYDNGYRMDYTVHAAPAGSDGVPEVLASQRLTDEDGTVLFESQGITRTESAVDGLRRVVDTAADGSRTTYTLGEDGQVATTQVYAADGALQQTLSRETIEGLPVVASRETLTRADGSQVVTEYDADRQPVGIREVDADGSVVQEVGSVKGERVDAGRADEIASEILDVGDRRFRRDDYEARLSYALETMQDLDPPSQQMVLTALQEQDSGMGDSWFRTGILENLSTEQMQVLEGGGLDILTGVPGTTAADLQAIKTIHELDVDADVYTGEYGELAATGDEQNAGQLQAFMTEYEARAGDPAAQARFVETYRAMHGDDFIEGFLGDEALGSALDGGIELYQGAGRIEIDRATHDALMGDRLETAADSRPDVLAARDRVMETGVRALWTDDYEARVGALVSEMQALDPEGQAALMRQIVKEDPDARLSWLRDSIINDATQGNEGFTPEMRALVTDIRANGGTTFGGQLLGFGSGVKNAGVGFVVGLGVLARTGYDLALGGIADPFTGGDGPAFLPSRERGLETGQAMIEGLPHMFAHIGEAWNQGRYGEAMGNVTFDVASMFIPIKIPKIRMPAGAGALDNVAGGADNFGGVRYIDDQGRTVMPPSVEPRLATLGPDGVYRVTDAAPPTRVGLDGPAPRLAFEAAPTAEVIAQRQAVAAEFYRNATGRVDPSHLNGIDFTRPVEVQTLREGTIVYQWQVPGAPKGSYFSPSPTARPSDIGVADIGVRPEAYARIREYSDAIDPNAPGVVRLPDGTYSGVDPRYGIEVAPSGIVDKAPTAYVVTRDVDVLVSTAKPIHDTWAIPDGSMASIPTQGGRLQIYTGNGDLFQPVVRTLDGGTAPKPVEVGELSKVDGRLVPLSEGQVLVGSSTSTMRSHAARHIAETPDHPLRFLVNPETGQFWTRADFGFTRGYQTIELFDNPVLLDMGHITSNKSLVNGGDRIMLQSVFDNQWNNMSIETPRIGGHVVDQRAVDIGGVAVSYNDVKMWTQLTVDADMAQRLAGHGYNVGDTFLPESVLDNLVAVN